MKVLVKNVEKYCYGNCYCKDTLASQIVEMRPICEDIGLWPPGPTCNENEDCAIKEYEEIYNMSISACNCTPYGIKILIFIFGW